MGQVRTEEMGPGFAVEEAGPNGVLGGWNGRTKVKTGNSDKSMSSVSLRRHCNSVKFLLRG